MKNRSYMFCLMGLVAIWLAACDIKKPEYPKHGSPRLTTTISSDGKLVAALDRTGTKAPRLRIKWVDKDEPWQALPAPKFTSDIRFALKGYDLLLAHDLPDNLDMAQITRWDVSDLSKESQMIHQGPWFAFPLEVKPGEYLVRTCAPQGQDFQQRDKNSCQTRGLGSYWVYLKPEHAPVRVTPKDIQPVYSQPNVTDKGFFWISDYVVGGAYNKDTSRPKHPILLSYAFPGGEAPKFEVEHLSPESRVKCDRTSQRCLRLYLAGTDPKTRLFVYDHEVLYRGQTCQPEGLQGYADEASVTPDGRAAVIPLATRNSETRRVVVLRFEDGQCKPTSIQHFSFEEK